MILSNEYVRKKLEDYIEGLGVTQRHISKKVGLSDTTISLFLKGQRELSDEKLETIYSIVASVVWFFIFSKRL